MKKKVCFFRFVLIVSFILLFPFVNLIAKDGVKAKQLSKQQQEWYDSKVWMQGVAASPDAGLDVMTFVNHYEKHPERWEKVFKFIKENDLETLPLGKQFLGDDVTVNVQEYITRDPGNEQLEGHQKYIDLQYVVEGCELQGYAKLFTATETVNPYDAKRDIAHFKVPVISYHVIRPNQFTVFFPDDIHMTNIQYGEKAKVRKVVFKVEVD